MWLVLEEKRVPYEVKKVNMNCYGDKPAWFWAMQPSGGIPVAKLDGGVCLECGSVQLAGGLLGIVWLFIVAADLHRGLAAGFVWSLRHRRSSSIPAYFVRDGRGRPLQSRLLVIAAGLPLLVRIVHVGLPTSRNYGVSY